MRIATRSSALALWQANFVARELQNKHVDLVTEIVHVTTQGDQNQSAPLHQMGGQGVFTREVQRYLLDGQADLAVHSLKDLPTIPTPGLKLGCVPPRENRFDVLICHQELRSQLTERPAANGEDPASILTALPAGTRIGSGSLRRQAQIRAQNRGVEVLEIRGNVDTRLRKLDKGEFDAIILAAAGLKRLEFEERLHYLLTPPAMYPAVGQGALGLECRDDDEWTEQAIRALEDLSTRDCVTAERSLLNELEAGCHAPVGAHCRYEAEQLRMDAVVIRPDGSQSIHVESTNGGHDPEAFGREVARELLAKGADSIL